MYNFLVDNINIYNVIIILRDSYIVEQNYNVNVMLFLVDVDWEFFFL